MILVVGATGTLGGRIVQRLVKNGKDVRILVRHNSPSVELALTGLATSAQSLIDAGAQPVYGDLTDRDSLDHACAGVETLITTATATKREGTETLESVDLKGTHQLIDAASDAGVGHFIYTSAYGSNPDDPVPLMRHKASCEARIQESGMDFTILLPGYFMEVWIGMVVGIPLGAGQPVTLVGKGDHKHSFVSEANVADFAVAALDNPAARKQRIPIGGPASYSWMEVVEYVRQATGIQVPVNFVPPGSPVPMLPAMVGALLTGMETYESYIDMSETAPLYGVELKTLDAFAKLAFAPSAGVQD